MLMCGEGAALSAPPGTPQVQHTWCFSSATQRACRLASSGACEDGVSPVRRGTAVFTGPSSTAPGVGEDAELPGGEDVRPPGGAPISSSFPLLFFPLLF
jgi:hypothetical protein